MFDSSKAGKIENEKVRTILNTLGLAINDLELEALLEEEDKEGKQQHGSSPESCHQAECSTTRKKFHGIGSLHRHFLTIVGQITVSFSRIKFNNLARNFRQYVCQQRKCLLLY
jgi:hypothetical protein